MHHLVDRLGLSRGHPTDRRSGLVFSRWRSKVDLTGIRAYLALPFGLACGLVDVIGRRTAKPVSAVGIAVSAIALVLGVLMPGSRVAG